ncbi:MAG: carbonate dehydratase [Chloroflexi bacterium]|jgi:GNAT superfamily N-acetyltransferase|nr:carbonate dehydratase [Chloroflexota bacterium]
MLKLVVAKEGKELAHIRELFLEYSRWIESQGASMDFQGFTGELAGLPGKYSEPEGSLLVAYIDGEAAGCGGLRKFKPEVCELKRLYIRPRFRRQGISRELSRSLIEKARAAGYKYMWLDTARFWVEPVALYRSLGFHEIDAYYDSPYASESYFMELDLKKAE